MRRTFVKRRADAPPGFFAAEAAGLAWLAEPARDAGARVVTLLETGERHLTLERLAPVRPAPRDAEAFGRALARTHAAGAPWHGAPPPGSPGRAWIGPLPLSVRTGPGGTAPGTDGGPTDPWGAFFATDRLLPYLRQARDAGAVDAAGARAVDAVCAALAAGDADVCGPAEPVARLHGDLWSGNVVWTADGGVLIDPSAHGGHRESDLAMLALFGAPHLERIVAAYDEVAPLADGWRRRTALHQLFPLLVHAVLFGGGYGDQAVAAARRYR